MGKPTRQLGTYRSNGPEEAVDGNLNQDAFCANPDSSDGMVNATLRGNPTWWSVDLGAGDSMRRFVVQSVTIYFRTCCQGNGHSRFDSD